MTYDLNRLRFSEILQAKYEALNRVNEDLLNRRIDVPEAMRQLNTINAHYDLFLEMKAESAENDFKVA